MGNFNLMENLIKKEYEFLSSLSVKEYILFKKWEEINSNPITSTERSLINQLKDDPFYFSDPYDYLNIEPIVIPIKTSSDKDLWKVIRKFHCSLVWSQNPGRCRKYIIKDRNSLKPLGIISLASDFTGIGGRNEHIGWNHDQIMNNGMLRYTANGSSIVPLQPFGYNCLGGKLIALLVLSDPVINDWNEHYPEPLVGITTTSLYGGFSQYNSLPYWKKVKSSSGAIELELSNKTMNLLKEEFGFTGPRAKKYCLQEIKKRYNIKVVNNAPRGVY
jgi:hypothetical protein